MSELTEAIRLVLDETQQWLNALVGIWAGWTCPDCDKGFAYSAEDEVADVVFKPCGGSGVAEDHDAMEVS